MTRNKLRVGILANVEALPGWAFYIIEQLQALDYAEISLIITEETPDKQTLTGRIVHAYLKAERRPSRVHTGDEIKALLDGIHLASASDPNLPADKLDLVLHLGAERALQFRPDHRRIPVCHPVPSGPPTGRRADVHPCAQ